MSVIWAYFHVLWCVSVLCAIYVYPIDTIYLRRIASRRVTPMVCVLGCGASGEQRGRHGKNRWLEGGGGAPAFPPLGSLPDHKVQYTVDSRQLFEDMYVTYILYSNRHVPVCMYGHTYSKSMNQPGKVANPARGQRNREN